jgi:DNA repair exonuclease SbcCD ATPase subunit
MRLKIFILSTMLITLISGVLFYKSLTQISLGKNALRIDLDELKTINLHLNNTAFYLRKNLNSDLSELQDERSRVNELISLVNDIPKNTPELKNSVEKIRKYFKNKSEQLAKFDLAIRDLRSSVNSLIPTYNELEKNNIKFVLDKRDFYRECILDSFMYISFSHKENETRISEDQKILGQIISYAQQPNPELQKFAKHIEVIHSRVKEIDFYLAEFKDDAIANDVKLIAKFYEVSVQDQNAQNENLLTFMFAAIGIYLAFVIFIIRKS